MNKKYLELAIIVIGLALIAYGILGANVTNDSETVILQKYDCGRLEKDARETDKYCYDRASAPEAKFNYGNAFTYSGVAITVLGSVLFVVNRQENKK